MNFGDLLISLRSRKNMSARELARILSASAPYICDVEKGKRDGLSLNRLCQVCRTFELTYGEQVQLFDLSAEAKNDIPVDIKEYLKENPDVVKYIRDKMLKENYTVIK